MYKVIVIDEDGNESITENVIDYNFIDVDLVQDIADDKGTELSEEEIEEVSRRCSGCEQLPNMEDLRCIIQDIIDDRE